MSTNDSLIRTVRAYQSEEEPERLFASAGNYWRFMLLTGALVCIAAIGAGAYMLTATFFAISVTGTQTVASQTLNQKQLSGVVAGFAARRAHFDEISKNPQPAVDPSK